GHSRTCKESGVAGRSHHRDRTRDQPGNVSLTLPSASSRRAAHATTYGRNAAIDQIDMNRQSEVTQLLSELGRGGPAAVDRLMPILYDELRHTAHRHMRGERPDHTLDTTALVHEAYVKLVGLDRMTWQRRAHFLAGGAPARGR